MLQDYLQLLKFYSTRSRVGGVIGKTLKEVFRKSLGLYHKTFHTRNYGAKTLSITTLSIMTFSIMTLSITTLSITTVSITTLSIMTLSIP